MRPIFLENFESAEDVFEQFGTEEDDSINILFAWYGDGGYCGAAFVLYEKDGELYEVNGSRCSWMGLEGQWEPEKTSKEALMHMMDEGDLGKDASYEGGNFADKLKEILEKS